MIKYATVFRIVRLLSSGYFLAKFPMGYYFTYGAPCAGVGCDMKFNALLFP